MRGSQRAVHGQRDNVNSITASIWTVVENIDLGQNTAETHSVLEQLFIKAPKMPSSAIYPDVKIPEVDLWGLMFEKEPEENFPFDQSELTESFSMVPD
jgi:hypothetical protein